VPITPDDKDWTWVLDRPCPECGFEAGHVDLVSFPAQLRSLAPPWEAVLARSDVAERPDDQTWSPLEYACHTRDVFRLYDLRLHLMLDEDDPHYPNWDQDETAVAEAYNQQDPSAVYRELAEAAEQVAASFEQVPGDDWQRTGLRSDGAHFSVETFASYFIHDPVHHLHDVGVPFSLA
jgi:hypothetical protein